MSSVMIRPVRTGKGSGRARCLILVPVLLLTIGTKGAEHARAKMKFVGGAGVGEGFVELFPIAQRDCTDSLAGSIAGVEVTVRFAPAIGAQSARLFLEGLAVFQTERAEDYEVYRSGLRWHIGDELFSKVADEDFLQPPKLETTWFLLSGTEPGNLMWRGGSDTRFFFVPSRDGPIRAEELQVRSTVRAKVHEWTHWVIWSLLAGGRRGSLPRWFEEGTCEYVAMQFERWKLKSWDHGRETNARLAWQRPAVRFQLRDWADPNTGLFRGSKLYHMVREDEWYSDIHYEGALGLIFGLETELGSGGLSELYREILTASPETEAATVAIIEKKLGKRIVDVAGPVSGVRERILETSLARANDACARGNPAPEGVPLGILGQFPEAVEAVAPVLHALVMCPNAAVAEQGLDGFFRLGLVEPLLLALKELRATGKPEVIATLTERTALRTADEMIRSKRRVEKFFRADRQRPPRTASAIRSAKGMWSVGLHPALA